ncbi:MAG: PEP-CTERM sorting domain-containing protein [Planctomycetota bacterium]
MIRSIYATCFALAITISAQAAPFVIQNSSDLFTPSFRGDSSTTFVGWDTFDDAFAKPPGLQTDDLIFDNTPDMIGSAAGTFATTNGEDHRSSSANYYSSTGSVAEDITFAVPGGASAFTTVIVQGKTLFGGFGALIGFGDIDGTAPTDVVFGTNSVGEAQFFAKYEILGAITTNTFSISSGPFSFVSLDQFTVDTQYSAVGFSADSAVAIPEPSSLAVIGMVTGTCLIRRRR